MPSLTIRLLGAVRLDVDGQRLPPPQRSDTLRVLACLLLAPDGLQARDELAARLWPEADPKRARANLRHGLHQLRGWLPQASDGQDWCLADRDRLAWNPEADAWCDARALQRVARRQPQPRQTRLAELRDLLALYTGPLLPGLEDAWTSSARAELAACQIRLLDALAEALEAAGDRRAAIEQARALLAIEPCHEPSHRRIMRIHDRRGDPAAALAQAQACRRALREQLGAAPSPETQALIDGLSEPRRMAADPPPARLQERAPDYGRIDALGRREAFLEALAETRLLTVWGPGGVGKTRLLREALRGVATAGPVRHVALAEARDVVGLYAALADGLGAGPGLPTPAALADRIGRGDLILVLDDCEQLSESLAELSEALLVRCPGLRLVLGSRERLRVRGERVLPLPRLSLEGDAALPGGEAGRLLLAALPPGRHDDLGLREALADIARALDGLPRALSQAALALRRQAPALLAGRLAESTAELDALARLTGERFESLASAFDHDLRRLSAGSRNVLGRLAEDLSPLDLPALLRVEARRPSGGSRAAGAALSPADIVEHLADLRDRALLEVELDARGQTRYRLLNTTRDLVRRRLG
ncbi:MAG: hypothetical protein H6648_01345 [Caldilineae bacterium]|nr:hypothetical protein [Caldilineae bacterium]